MIGGDLNGHVGKTSQGLERINGGWALGDRSQDGERVMDFTVSFDMGVLNTFFKKQPKLSYNDYEDVEEWWERNNNILKRVGREVLGLSTGKGPKDKETWWWGNYGQEEIKIKINAKKRYDETGTEEDKERSRLAKKETKVAVVQSKQQELHNVYEDLDTKEGQKKIFKTAKGRNKATKDITHIKQTKKEDGVDMCSSSIIKGGWKQYFERLLNEGNPRSIIADGNPNLGMVRDIDREEIKVAFSKMKKRIATGPDEIPVEVWKCLGEFGVDMLWDLMKKIL
ncbi:uncharacterized protein [Palaemon carinicauda]|uniref:uncharacterized protein n=1 Tax=Palaemon carinicauda TaxID=392227 RepID=UPI0035B62FD4